MSRIRKNRRLAKFRSMVSELEKAMERKLDLEVRANPEKYLTHQSSRYRNKAREILNESED